jgi:hypothetical protein
MLEKNKKTRKRKQKHKRSRRTRTRRQAPQVGLLYEQASSPKGFELARRQRGGEILQKQNLRINQNKVSTLLGVKGCTSYVNKGIMDQL